MSEADVPAADEAHMRRALVLAANGLGLASPNPLVGAVVVDAAGRVVGEGWHEGPGTPHAEVMALTVAGDRARDGTLYVTLEPCSHHGRTPPCAPAVADAGVARVVASIRDPNPVVDGRGFALLREAGVEVSEGVLAREAKAQNAGFFRHVATGRPFVVLKMAASLDGKVAARDGSSRWVTGEEARADAHLLRAWSDAVVVGSGTALADDPALTVRLPRYRGRQPLRVVVDGGGRLRAGSRVLQGAPPTLVATTPGAPSEVREAWARAGADVVVFEPAGHVPLAELVAELGKRDLRSVVVEGGPTLAWSFVRQALVDRIVLYVAPKLLGGSRAPGVLGGDGVASIADAVGAEIVEVERVGADLKVVADVHRDR